MPENFTLYSQTYDALPEEQMRSLARDADFSSGDDADGDRRFVYRWPGVSVTINEMPAQAVPDHLTGFRGYVNRIYQGKPDGRGKQILDRISYTRLVAGVIIEPSRDEEGRAEHILGSMSYGLHALMFHGTALYDRDSKLILAPDGTFDRDADVLGPVAEMIKNRVQVQLPEREPYRPTAAQEARYKRVLAELQRRKIPTVSGALYIDDDAATDLRTPDEVARRLLVLHAVTVRADGGPLTEALPLTERHGLWPEVSPEERLLLENEEADERLTQKLLWRLEGLWVLAWALGALDDLPWPSGFCDVPRLVKAVRSCGERADFITKATLRPKADILDALQLTLLQHWAVRDAVVHNRKIPIDLDWMGHAEMVPVRSCPTTGVVAERHYALNWLVRFGDADWDDVDTPT